MDSDIYIYIEKNHSDKDIKYCTGKIYKERVSGVKSLRI